MERTKAVDSLTADSIPVDFSIGAQVSVELEVEALVVDSVIADSVAVDLKSVKPWAIYQ